MLQLSKMLNNRKILSLRTGQPVGVALRPLINPDNLKIVGFYCQSKLDQDTLILLPQDIRETMKQGFVINDHEVLTPPEDLVRLKKVIDIDYQLKSVPVQTESGKKLGKVDDYAVDSKSLYVQKLYVTKPVLKSLGMGGQLSIDRSQITNITPKKIIVKDLKRDVRQTAVSPAVAS